MLIAKDIIPLGGKAHSASSHGSSSSPSHGQPGSPKTPLPASCTSAHDIPSSAKGTWMDPTSWLDLTDFNCTYTDQTVGGLPVVGLNSTWDDSAQANPNVPALNSPWGSYATQPFRGINLGGWFSLEPFITPSLFSGDSTLVDEYTLCTKLGPQNASATLEQHYSTFITEDDFQAIASAGLDHVRIPYSYWAVKTYDNDPYVFGVSWRYLLRAIEWARKYGLRVKLDLHAVPGSQNGWNHSGKQGAVDWILGPDGAVNAQRSLDIHTMLSQFFAQDRYKNIIVFYGLVNEPSLSIPQSDLVTWTTQAYNIVHGNGVNATNMNFPARPCEVWTPVAGQADGLWQWAGHRRPLVHSLRRQPGRAQPHEPGRVCVPDLCRSDHFRHEHGDWFWASDGRRMVAGRYRLRPCPEWRGHRLALDGHLLWHTRPRMPDQKQPMQLRHGQRRPVHLHLGLQDILANMGRGADGRL